MRSHWTRLVKAEHNKQMIEDTRVLLGMLKRL